MFKNVKLRTKLLVTGISLAVVPLALIAFLVINQNSKVISIVEEESTKLATADLDAIARIDETSWLDEREEFLLY